MTPVAADRFVSSTQTVDNRVTGNNRAVKSTKQMAQLMRTGNLTDWNSSHADVQLQPSSCVENYFDLVLRGNPLQLLPLATEDRDARIGAESSTLSTRHQSGKLRLRCHKLEVETTATDLPPRYKLFLAAGFLAYKLDGETKRAPILLIPVTIERLRGRASPYALRYQAGKPLRINPHITSMCSEYIDPLVAPFETTTDLRAYLRAVQSKVHKNFNSTITANTGIISLQADVISELSRQEILDTELERTKPGIEFKPLPATPAAFDPQLAIRVLRFVQPENLDTALQNFAGQFASLRNTSNTPIEDVDPDLDSATLEKYHNCAAWLIDIGLGHWKLKNIATLPRRVEAMAGNINALTSNTEYARHFRDEYRTVDMLFRLNKTKDKILNSPPEMQHHAISLHADANTRLMLQQAKIQATSLNSEMKVIKDTFHMSAVPSSQTLHRLIEIIAKREDESQLANPDYFRARRALNEILEHHNGILTDNDLARLKSLAGTLNFSEKFNNDPYYKRHFGGLFKGKDTNWQRLDSVVNYTHELSQDLGSSLLVAQFADQWVSFERDFGYCVSQIETAASSAHKLCALIPMLVNTTTRLEHAARVAEKFSQRVDVWQKYLHRNFADTELTPFQLLSNIDLGDHNYPTVTLSQQELDERIYRHIVDNGLQDKTVAATSEWLLNVVVRHGTDTATVRRFLDKEAVLYSNLR